MAFCKLKSLVLYLIEAYDETDLLKPEQIDKFTGCRLYSTKQIPILNKIVFLRDIGFSVAEIAVVLSQWNNEYVTKQLENKHLEIENATQAEQEKLPKVELAKKDIQQEKIAMHYNVSIKSIPSYQVLSLRRITQDYDAEGELWKGM